MTRLERRRHTARRRIRAATTALEDALWGAIAQLPGEGRHFARQVTIGPYLADFVSHRLRIVIEIDGAQHGFPDQRRKDEARDAWLESLGYLVLRFCNADVRTDAVAVIDSIRAVVEERRTAPPCDPPFTPVPVEGKRRPRPR